MKKFIFLMVLFLLIYGCNQNKSHQISANLYLLEPISNDLNGIKIRQEIKEKNRLWNNRNYKATAFYHSADEKISEIDLHIIPRNGTNYQLLLEFYNQKFKTSHIDSVFNTWQTDSTSFILYKNSDSSILVNIFNRKN